MSAPSNEAINRALRTAALKASREIKRIERMVGGENRAVRQAFSDLLSYHLNGHHNAVIDDSTLTRIVPDAEPEDTDSTKKDSLPE